MSTYSSDFGFVRRLMDHVQTPSGSSSGPPHATGMGAVGTNEATRRLSEHSAASPMARIGDSPYPSPRPTRSDSRIRR
jgi:hypothetical protein